MVSAAEFAESVLTRAVLRGGRYVGVQALGDLAASGLKAMSTGGFCYGFTGSWTRRLEGRAGLECSSWVQSHAWP